MIHIDQEIFRLRDEIEKYEGVGTTFYDFIQAKPRVNQEDLNKAYKKRSRELHPDKVKQQYIAKKTTKKNGYSVGRKPSKADIAKAAQDATDRFARLGLVNAVLKGPGRARYDHFLSNGFPAWKGTGYYYARLRPGLGSVLIGLFVAVGGAGHYLALYLSWKRQQDFVGRYIKFARNAAWGDNFNVPGLDTPVETSPTAANDEVEEQQRLPRNRKERRMMEKDEKRTKVDKKSKYAKRDKGTASAATAMTPTPPAAIVGPKKRVIAENGKILVVDSAGNVYLEQKDAEGTTQEFLLDVCFLVFIGHVKMLTRDQIDELQQPTWKSTALYRAPVWAYNLTAGRFLNKSITKDENINSDEDGASDSPATEEEYEVVDRTKISEPNGTGKAVKRSKKAVNQSFVYSDNVTCVQLDGSKAIVCGINHVSKFEKR